jgi:diguanylate cyclase (GGDEF)-like protein
MVRTVSRIRSCIRPFDAMGRFGSDIFLLVLPGASHLVSRAVAERIRISVMTHPEVIETESISLSVTVGTSSTDQFPDVEPEDFISLAERALLSAKNIGQNNIVQASPVSI